MACRPDTGFADARVIERLGAACRVRKHVIGARLGLWELLPDPAHQPRPVFATEGERFVKV